MYNTVYQYYITLSIFEYVILISEFDRNNFMVIVGTHTDFNYGLHREHGSWSMKSVIIILILEISIFNLFL